MTLAPLSGSPVLDQIPVGTTADSVTLCPGTDQRGVTRPQETQCDIGAVELAPVVASGPAITSMDSATATVRSPFSFTVTTTGTPVPRITKKGALPKGVGLVDNGNGTATLSGTPTRAGTYHLTIKASFGKGKTKKVVSQTFTLTVAPAT